MVKQEIAKWKEEFNHVWRRTLIMAVLAPFVLGIGVAVTGARDNLHALWSLPTTTSEQFVSTQAAIEANTRAINKLRIPAKIFEISERSGPVDGYCVRGTDCVYTIRARRLPDALQCRVEPPFEYLYRDASNNEEFSVDHVRRGLNTARNLGTSYVNIEQTFSTPLTVGNIAEFCIRGKYSGCPGQTDPQQVITQSDECIGVVIRD